MIHTFSSTFDPVFLCLQHALSTYMNGQQVDHQINLKFKDMICLATDYFLIKKKKSYISPFKFGYFSVFLK